EVAFSISRDELLSGRDAAETLLLAEWESASGELADAVHYFRAVKQLRLEAPRLDYEVSDVGGGYEVALRSDRLAKNLYLRLDGADGFFSDNYFDLLPGRDRVVRLQTELDLESVQKAIRLRTLDSSY
ncbi:MAG: glycoside hydrolase family 2 protein, partial [Planctomycetota bacterium]